ncbi:MAG: type II toxin-antitoxin system RelB/DinJ family antitoxin [Clostridiales bacterium]|jgi:addiction module RelB/DinJ family antitoxin|nr:type II toxin-antitoxin system RelB/DinJ family antitoxin [Clostridiales bacterium]
MVAANIYIRVDNELKTQAQQIFVTFGLNMTVVISVFLRQVVRQCGISFAATVLYRRTERKIPKFSGSEGKIWMSNDFDAPQY